MAKYCFIFFVGLCFSFLPIQSVDRMDSAVCFGENTVFNANEELKYNVYYNWNFIWARAGIVRFSAVESTYAGIPSYLFKATGTTLDAYDKIFKVRDYYQSYVEKANMRPLKYTRDINEGGYTRYEELRFNYDNKTIASKSGKTKDKVETKQYPLGACTFDVVSIMYHLRNIDFDNYKVGDKIPINIFFDKKQYDLHVKYLGIEEVKVKKQGRFRCYKLSPLLIAGEVFTETQKMFVYVTADENKLPVLVESPIRIGSIKAVIANTENLKYPLDAKIK